MRIKFYGLVISVKTLNIWYINLCIGEIKGLNPRKHFFQEQINIFIEDIKE